MFVENCRITTREISKEIEFDLLRRAMVLGEEKKGSEFRSSTSCGSLIKLFYIPSRFLPVVCAKNKEGQIELTPMGKIIRDIYRKMAENNIEGYVLLTPGGAQEAIQGAKPFTKTKMGKDGGTSIDQYEIRRVCPPIIDGDFLVVINNCETEKVINLFSQNNNGAEELQIKLRYSPSRGTTRIEIGKLIVGHDWRRFWVSAGHINILNPEFSGRNYEHLSELVAARDSNQHFILLIPINTKEGLNGVEIDFFPKWRHLPRIKFRQRNHEGKIIMRSIKPTIIPSFELAFSTKNSFPEAFAQFVHLLKTCTWENVFPVINSGTFRYPETFKSASLYTSQTLAKEIVYPLTENPNLIIQDTDTMRSTTTRLLHSFRQALNGDPYLGFIYFLSAGEGPPDSPVFGMGLIDPKGPFPHLHSFLHQGDRLERLLSIMEVCDYGSAQKGWSTFVSFLYRETNHNLTSVVKLLTPTFCLSQIYPTLVENYVRRTLEKVEGVGMKLNNRDYYPSWPVEPSCF